jgi:hypothetical protein
MVLGLFAPQIQWMAGQPGDAWGLSFLFLGLLALGIIFGLRWLSRKPKSFRSDLTKQMLETPVRHFRKKHRSN